MEETPESYELESIDQLRALADDLRQQVIEILTRQAMTAKQLGDALSVAAAKAHYHVRELERVGLVRIVETREKGGILEKYYRAVAQRLSVPPSLVQRLPPDDYLVTMQAMLDDINKGFTNAVSRAARSENDEERRMALLRSHLRLSKEKFRAFSAEIQELLERYEVTSDDDAGRQYTAVVMAYDTALSAEKTEPWGEISTAPMADPAPAPSYAPHVALSGALSGTGGRARSWAAGLVSFNRADMERAIQRGKRLDISILGVAHFASDVTPDLAERAIERFRYRGRLQASPEVQAVLERKSAGGARD